MVLTWTKHVQILDILWVVSAVCFIIGLFVNSEIRLHLFGYQCLIEYTYFLHFSFKSLQSICHCDDFDAHIQPLVLILLEFLQYYNVTAVK